MIGKIGIDHSIAAKIDGLAAVATLLIICIGINWLCQLGYKWYSLHSNRIQHSKWHPYLKKHKLVHNIILIIPGLFFYTGVWLLFSKGDQSIVSLHRLCIVYLVIVTIKIFNSILLVFLDIYSRSEKNKSHPLKGLVQGLQVILYFIGGIIIIALLINKSPVALITGLGASAAVLMLIFKDSILGFVAGVQLSQNNMIQIGDWIELKDGSANGIVEEITLNTVKVRNWDNTLTMIPPYSLVSAPFKNWRGMLESNGRRVDKMLYLDMRSLEICSPDMVADIRRQIPIMKDYYVDSPANSQLFRVYIERYLRSHPDVAQDQDLIITQKQQSEYGLPVEIYFFLSEKTWKKYETIQSDIFDHIIAMAPEFGLRLYQLPSEFR